MTGWSRALISPLGNGPSVSLSSGAYFPSWSTTSVVRHTGDGTPDVRFPEVQLRLVVEDGGVALDAWSVLRHPGVKPLTAQSVARVPLGELTNLVIERLLIRAALQAQHERFPMPRQTGSSTQDIVLRGDEVWPGSDGTTLNDVFASAESATATAIDGRRRWRRGGDELYRRVASVFESAEAAGQDPIGAVMRVEHGSKRSAQRWVAEARARGLL